MCTVRFDGGLDVPLGPIVNRPQPAGKRNWYRWGHNEYVTYKDSQTALRYLVRIRDNDASGEGILGGIFGRRRPMKKVARKY